MKKLMTIIAAMAMILSLTAIPAFAAGSFDDLDIDYSEIQGTTATSQNATDSVPFYGYVGPDASIVDPNPDDEDEKPDVSPYAVNVSVPTKIIWAAFETDGGTITAPNYYIKNNSYVNDLEVTMVSFTADGTTTSANTAIDKYLTLNVESTGTDFNKQLVVNGDNNTATYHINNAKLGTKLESREQWDFTVSGTFGGAFPTTAIEPKYNMTLKFEVTV